LVKRVIGVIIIILALGTWLVPQLTKCHNSAMTCNYTAKAELALAIPLAVEGLVLVFSRKESTKGLAIVGAAVGVSVILIDYVLIGVCVSMIENMHCQTIMKPSLLLFGILEILVNGWLFLVSKSGKT
jgi:Domain of unknown function (DUF4418)